jgi:putative membrane protein
MIKYNPKLWFSHILSFKKSDTLLVLLPEIIIVGFYTYGLCYLFLDEWANTHVEVINNATAVHTLIGFVMGMLLVFRTNTAYDRWWEGRKQWGALVNNARNFILKVNNFVTDKQKVIILKNYTKAFVNALKEHLRDNNNLHVLPLSENDLVAFQDKMHLPNAIVNKIYFELHQLNYDKQISNEELIILDKEVKSFIDILGACERIKNTPIPFSYSTFIKKFIFIYVSTLPLGFIPNFGYWTVPITMFVFYVFVSLELLAEEIEDPFGTDQNDLPTDELSLKIANNLDEITQIN